MPRPIIVRSSSKMLSELTLSKFLPLVLLDSISFIIFESSFLLKSSRLVYDKETIFISNNQNKFFAINSRNGLIKWEQAINSYLDPVVIKDFIITISEEGYLVVMVMFFFISFSTAASVFSDTGQVDRSL